MTDATIAASPARDARPDMLELTSARGFAAVAVVIYHVDAYCGGALGNAFHAVRLFGPLAVDFFFALSGFVLTHVYLDSWREGRYSHAGFLVKRFARVWPLHMACLIGVGAIVLVGARFGLAPQWEPSWSSFLAHAAMLHATGLSPEKAWNQPSWSVSAEWTAYLVFPLYLMLSQAVRSPLAKIVVAIFLFDLLLLIVNIGFGADFFRLTTGGALRIIPLFFAGVVLREIMEMGVGRQLGAGALNLLALAALAAILVGAALDAPFLALWPGLLALLYLLALRAQNPAPNVVRARPFLWLGEVSYALYLVHAPVLMVVYGVGAKLFGVDRPAELIALGVAAAGVAVVAAAVGHYAIERPAQKLILRLADRLEPGKAKRRKAA